MGESGTLDILHIRAQDHAKAQLPRAMKYGDVARTMGLATFAALWQLAPNPDPYCGLFFVLLVLQPYIGYGTSGLQLLLPIATYALLVYMFFSDTLFSLIRACAGTSPLQFAGYVLGLVSFILGFCLWHPFRAEGSRSVWLAAESASSQNSSSEDGDREE